MKNEEAAMSHEALMQWYKRGKRQHPFAGLSFFQGDIIAARHWPASLTWSWILRWSWPDGGKRGAHHKWGIHRYTHNLGGWFVVGPFWLHWQHEMPFQPRPALRSLGGE